MNFILLVCLISAPPGRTMISDPVPPAAAPSVQPDVPAVYRPGSQVIDAAPFAQALANSFGQEMAKQLSENRAQISDQIRAAVHDEISQIKFPAPAPAPKATIKLGRESNGQYVLVDATGYRFHLVDPNCVKAYIARQGYQVASPAVYSSPAPAPVPSYELPTIDYGMVGGYAGAMSSMSGVGSAMSSSGGGGGCSGGSCGSPGLFGMGGGFR